MAEKTTSTIRFKAAILEKQNKPLRVDDVSIYLPGLGVGQVLVKVHCSSICGAQIGEISGANGKDPYLPHLLGHEGGGVVEEIGAGVTTVKKGDHVVMHWRKGDGIEAKPPRYQWGDGYKGFQGGVGAGPIATFAEYAIVSENRLTSIDDEIPFDIAALMGCCVTTGLGIINNDAKLKIGQSIAVIGCGGVGLSVIQGAVMVSADPIIAIDIHDVKLDMAGDLGATDCLNPTCGPLIFYPVDVVVECTGIPEMIDKAYQITAPGGCLILAGQPRYNQEVVIHRMRQHYQGKIVLDSQGGATNPTVDIPRYLNLYRAGKLKLDERISHRFPLSEINLAVEKVKSRKVGKIILEM